MIALQRSANGILNDLQSLSEKEDVMRVVKGLKLEFSWSGGREVTVTIRSARKSMDWESPPRYTFRPPDGTSAGAWAELLILTMRNYLIGGKPFALKGYPEGGDWTAHVILNLALSEG